MRHKLFLSVAVAVVGCFGYAQASSIKTGKVKSEILGVEKEYTVYLPDGYDNNGDTYYPVLYLLHGASDTHEAWKNKGRVQAIADQEIRAGFALPMIIVMPDARGEGPNNVGKNLGYFNQQDWAYEDHFFKEFIPYIEEAYRIRKDRGSRAVAGLSMGGGGSTVYAMRHPDVFCSACPMSGVVGAFEGLGGSLSELWKQAAANAPVGILDNATEEELKAIKAVRWYIDCGDDDFLFDGNIELVQKMRRKGVPFQFRVRDGGHTWEYWQSGLHEILKFISIGFAK